MIKEFRRLLPSVVIMFFGLIAACLLTALVFQYLLADKPLKQLVPEHSAPTAEQPLSSTPSTVETIGSAPETTKVINSAPVTAPTPKPAPKPAPSATPTLGATVIVSTDGCTVTATGTPGLTLYIHTHNDRKGGESTAPIPANEVLTVSAGGIQGMTVEAKVLDSNGTILAEAYGTITKLNCWDY